ncbi:L-ascorbate metabolism protein UlaG, beta-lactamase superfamily [Tenacibaculum sp. MAR_2009_124]|uniref:MBL fold metallo-hydrolase n=1 Tax=Tenacibaculum sp. MAR_2009_124 TaxID=1250059 RepID=UPI000894CE40|nr:MBL fold metallo-hydrolase [Tenacibaculum sp. MAR_2009_124]SEB79732.1 L-ascorbate metabolism protein UlaG, beta-lactamase superfamily [Tenacibaculum sp. MAR_2009_124]
MKKRSLLCLFIFIIYFSCQNTKQILNSNKSQTSIRFIRQATFILTINSKRLLVDPVLSKKGELEPIPFSNNNRNPQNELPISTDEIINSSDAILITHYHPDHFDIASEKLIPKDKKIFCQPYDLKMILSKGFTNVKSIDKETFWGDIKINRFEVHHHEGATGTPPFGESSSFSISNKNKSIFITGDAILDSYLKNALLNISPDFIVANTGECSFSQVNPVLSPGITMTLTKEELITIAKEHQNAVIIPMHMDAINHCSLSKESLKEHVKFQVKSIKSRFQIPFEGETIKL